ncbi:hypothetical protein SLA2020_219980 [Shorea laevis]
MLGWSDGVVGVSGVGLNTLNKAATSKGTSSFVLVVYGNALGSLILLPIAFFLNWTKRPPIDFSVLSKFFLLSFVGIIVMQNCMSTGVLLFSSFQPRDRIGKG